MVCTSFRQISFGHVLIISLIYILSYLLTFLTQIPMDKVKFLGERSDLAGGAANLCKLQPVKLLAKVRRIRNNFLLLTTDELNHVLKH